MESMDLGQTLLLTVRDGSSSLSETDPMGMSSCSAGDIKRREDSAASAGAVEQHKPEPWEHGPPVLQAIRQRRSVPAGWGRAWLAEV